VAEDMERWLALLKTAVDLWVPSGGGGALKQLSVLFASQEGPLPHEVTCELWPLMTDQSVGPT
jgi:hypothetical protein